MLIVEASESILFPPSGLTKFKFPFAIAFKTSPIVTVYPLFRVIELLKTVLPPSGLLTITLLNNAFAAS